MLQRSRFWGLSQYWPFHYRCNSKICQRSNLLVMPTATSSTHFNHWSRDNCSFRRFCWLATLFSGITGTTQVLILQIDNAAAVRLTENPEFHRRTKHIDLKHFYVNEEVNEGKVIAQYVPTQHPQYQLADLLIKLLGTCRHLQLSRAVGMIS